MFTALPLIRLPPPSPRLRGEGTSGTSAHSVILGLVPRICRGCLLFTATWGLLLVQKILGTSPRMTTWSLEREKGQTAARRG
ncbi:MAG TPA: hypothetical protein DIC56_15245 [Rhizobium sp.]|nr:hypothetical protein [Rhizobium sp.]